ncbi:hypothetical protein FEM48_Zijuj09G0090800 [Ziziphus jujuba var. spinosa]|uniref:R13L1/DRL21-like LRR repeat region domain-containing protein n=1 Tax=Ziziphus jujuba var. spinosa TaxID=714518 RepID=A0A978US36_ZIZJJ|nr:hypothetical protein FEM48_Zijuj09G0090800 [Ziziphus jujuba var. spinosa]
MVKSIWWRDTSQLEQINCQKCLELTLMPEIHTIQHLELHDCLATLARSFQNLTSLKILVFQKIGLYRLKELFLQTTLLHLWKLNLVPTSYLPQEELQNHTGLHSLKIRSCPGLEALPEWIEKLVSLRSIGISDCKNITFLPQGISVSLDSCTYQFKIALNSWKGVDREVVKIGQR